MMFYDDDILVKYEQYEEWDKTYEHLNNLMCSQSENKSILYRFAAQCWYVLTFWHKPFLRFQNSLQRIYISKLCYQKHL